MKSDELKLKELAEAATQGEWRFARGEDDGIHVVHSHVWGPKTHIGGSSSTDVDADREYIAAANPTAILSLLTRIEALEQDAKHLHVKLAGETLRADQGWERYEASNKAHMACLNERAAEIGKAMEG